LITLDDFIRKGYFPEELIPPFYTEELANIIPELMPPLKTWFKKIGKCSSHTIPRLKHLRRHLSLPNPLNQILLCDILEKNWNEIEEFVSKSTISMTTPKVINDSKRAVMRAYNYSEISSEIAMRSTAARYMLRTDISRFYPTLYTHSIPWALHSKVQAKAVRNSSLFGNQIDKFVRNSMDGQTIGIPIGPDSSLIVAEIIATAIDQMLIAELGNIEGLRYMDDFFLFFSTFAEAEDALFKLHAITKDFELELKSEKTSIKELPEPLESEWVSEFRYFTFKQNKTAQRNNLIGYFSKAFEYSKLYNADYVLKYTLSKIRYLLVESDNWKLYQSLLMKSAIAEPATLPTVLQILLAYSKKGFTLDKNIISGTLTEIIIYNSKFNHGYEVSWAMWIAKSLKIPLNEEVAKSISTVDDSIVAIVALDLFNSGLIPKGFDVTKWKKIMQAKELYDNNWLLAYEAYIKGWLKSVSGKDYLLSDDFFSILQKNNVSFYDNTRQVPEIELKTPMQIKDKKAETNFYCTGVGGGGY